MCVWGWGGVQIRPCVWVCFINEPLNWKKIHFQFRELRNCLNWWLNYVIFGSLLMQRRAWYYSPQLVKECTQSHCIWCLGPLIRPMLLDTRTSSAEFTVCILFYFVSVYIFFFCWNQQQQYWDLQGDLQRQVSEQQTGVQPRTCTDLFTADHLCQHTHTHTLLLWGLSYP